jgi:hypothetical protein
MTAAGAVLSRAARTCIWAEACLYACCHVLGWHGVQVNCSNVMQHPVYSLQAHGSKRRLQQSPVREMSQEQPHRCLQGSQGAAASVTIFTCHMQRIYKDWQCCAQDHMWNSP